MSPVFLAAATQLNEVAICCFNTEVAAAALRAIIRAFRANTRRNEVPIGTLDALGVRITCEAVGRQIGAGEAFSLLQILPRGADEALARSIASGIDIAAGFVRGEEITLEAARTDFFRG